MSDQLLSVIDTLVDSFEDEHGDWDDVLQRHDLIDAGSAKDLGVPVKPATRWWHRRRPLTLAIAAIALFALLFATPAFGLRSLVLDLIGRVDSEFETSSPAPTVVKREFSELGVGAPQGMDPQAIAGETREVRPGPGDTARVVYVAPTRKGGVCFLIDGVGGGCRTSRSPLELDGTSYAQPLGEQPYLQRLAGTVQEPDARTLTVEFEDGVRRDLPFVYVSRPIDMGFFVYRVPAAEREPGHRPKTVILRDGDGKPLASRNLDYTRKLPTGPFIEAPLPTSQAVGPSAPRQVASVDGVRVVVGDNGVVIFDAAQIDPVRGKLLSGRRALYACFRIPKGAGGEPHSLGTYGRFAPLVALKFNRLRTPVDGCEIQGSYGHRWPDRLGSHSVVEIPFTERANRYFEDRAAARDLANLVRSHVAKQLRRQEGTMLANSLRATFGGAITQLSARRALPPKDKIGYWINPSGVIFTRVSPTGRVYRIEIENGRIAHQNVEPLAMVY